VNTALQNSCQKALSFIVLPGLNGRLICDQSFFLLGYANDTQVNTSLKH